MFRARLVSFAVRDQLPLEPPAHSVRVPLHEGAQGPPLQHARYGDVPPDNNVVRHSDVPRAPQAARTAVADGHSGLVAGGPACRVDLPVAPVGEGCPGACLWAGDGRRQGGCVAGRQLGGSPARQLL